MTTRRKHTKEINAWNNARSRCINPTVPGYSGTGAVGIKMCQRWIYSFPTFLADMGESPQDSRLDRYNKSGDYEPQNCYWKPCAPRKPHTKTPRTYATRPGKKADHYLTAKGRTDSVVNWAVVQNIPYETLLWRKHQKWSDEQVLGMEPPPNNAKLRKPYTRHYLTWQGKTQGPRAWARELNMPPRVIYDRLERGWTAEQALTTPVRKYLP